MTGLLIAVTLLWTVVVALLCLGVVVPIIPGLGEAGSFFVGSYPLHFVLFALVGVGLAVLLLRLRARRTGATGLGLGVFAVLASAVVLVAQAGTASSQGVSVAWTEPLTTLGQPDVHPDRTIRYTTDLDLDVWLPAKPATGPRPAVVWVHGGGFMAGGRREQRGIARWLAERGYPVFDIDYRLAPPPRWKDASQDVACALSWVARNAGEYQVDPARLMIVGGSAGGSLALNVAYGLADKTITSSCGGEPPVPAVVGGYYPAADLVGVYEDDGFFGYTRTVGTNYVGGTPSEFPERYREASALTRVRPGLMPTLLVTGGADHLIWPARVTVIADRLRDAGVPHRMVVVPFAEHAYDAAYGSVGGQISCGVLGQFLTQYLPL